MKVHSYKNQIILEDTRMTKIDGKDMWRLLTINKRGCIMSERTTDDVKSALGT